METCVFVDTEVRIDEDRHILPEKRWLHTNKPRLKLMSLGHEAT